MHLLLPYLYIDNMLQCICFLYSYFSLLERKFRHGHPFKKIQEKLIIFIYHARIVEFASCRRRKRYAFSLFHADVYRHRALIVFVQAMEIQ